MEQHILIQLASILVLGITAQWLAWRLRLPSILLLLGVGVIAGPVTGFLQPDKLFGDLLLPIVSLSVAVILFEGGLTLRISELKAVGNVLLRLTTIGAVATFLIGTVAAHFIVGMDWPLAALLGSLLIVTGPTVIGPLLRHLRLEGQVASLLRWEGIVIDPIGATLAVIVFSVVRTEGVTEATTGALLSLVMTLGAGFGLGAVGAVLLTWFYSRFWIPDPLHNGVSLMSIFAVFSLSNAIQAESGLLAVTVMGIGLANQRFVSVRHLIEFKENLSVLLLSCLFIVLAARIHIEGLRRLDLHSALFVLVLVVLARPVCVWLSTLGSQLNWRERVFLACMAPRGIVAAAVSSVFAIEMVAHGHEDAVRMAPLMFLVIVCTVGLYGLGAAPLARWLRLATPNPQGVLFVGAHAWARELASTLQTEGFNVLLIDSDWEHIAQAKLAGLPAHYGSVLAERTTEDVELAGLGRLFAMTANDELNSLACLRFIEYFGRGEVYQLPFDRPAEGRRQAVSMDQRGRLLFGPGMSYAEVSRRYAGHPAIKVTRLTKEFDYEAHRQQAGEHIVPLLLIDETGVLKPFTVDSPLAPKPGQVLISIAPSLEGTLAAMEPAQAVTAG